MIFRRVSRLVTAFVRQDRGSVAVITALTLILLFGMIGLGVDTSVWYTNKRRIQVMAEITALNAGRLLSGSTQTATSITTIVKNVALLNGFSTATDAVSVAFSPAPPPGATSVTVSVTRTLPLLFSSIFLQSRPTVTQAATVMYRQSNNGCIYVLDPSSAQSLLVNGGFKLNAPACTINVASTSGSAAIFDSGSSLQVAKTCVAGNVLNNGGAVGGLQTACTPPRKSL